MKNIIESTPPVSLRNYFTIRKNVPNQQFQDVTFTLRGRDAIALAVRHFGLQKHDTVLLPGYLCKITVTPFTHMFNPDYYDINKDFSINTEVIESILSSRKIKVLYVIHYFGFLHRNIAQLSKLCKKYGVMLWEDHAHSALSDISYNYADAMIFSFRKILPIPDGGGLWLANFSPIKMSGISAISSNITSMLILAKRTRWAMGKKFLGVTHGMSHYSTASIHDGSKEITPRSISHMSKCIIRHVDIKSIFDIRRNIFKKWQRLFSKSRFRPVFSSLPDDICPQSFPIWIRNPEEMLSKFWNANIFLRNRWPLEEQKKEKCPTAFEISNSIFALPIYPDLLESDMNRMMALLERNGEPLTTPHPEISGSIWHKSTKNKFVELQ